MAKTNLNDLETVCSLILKLSHFNLIHQVFLVLISVRVCLGAGVDSFPVLYVYIEGNTPNHQSTGSVNSQLLSAFSLMFFVRQDEK